MRIVLTGGIACGKSLLSFFLRQRGFRTCDADDIVHELVPEEERRRLAAVVFKDPAARKALEDRLHPIVRQRLQAFSRGAGRRIAVIPLLFEVHWESDYDIIVCVTSARDKQIERMMTTRGYTREEAESRLAAQMSVEEKARLSHYVISNDGTSSELEAEVERFITWLDQRIGQ